jgi:hypothetical protein
MIAFNNLAGIVAFSIVLAGTFGSAAPAPSPDKAVNKDDIMEEINRVIDSTFGATGFSGHFKREDLESETLAALLGPAKAEAESLFPGRHLQIEQWLQSMGKAQSKKVPY